MLVTQTYYSDQFSLTAPIAEILNGTSFIAMRSIASKLVPSDELGECSLKNMETNIWLDFLNLYDKKRSAVNILRLSDVPNIFANDSLYVVTRKPRESPLQFTQKF
jgi:hypothetical protein